MKQVSGNKYNVIGIMSGTSLDGLDLAAVEFQFENEKWNFNLISTQTVPYTNEWLDKLKNAPTLSSGQLTQLDSEYGSYIGNQAKNYIDKISFSPTLIASHGHTIFHQPEKGFTLQIGNGAKINAITKIKTICDFRTLDVALGGQGAPLVPVGDKFLFSDFEYCLNLGGFSNISFEVKAQRIAFDICPVNFVLNHFAEKQGSLFDKNGEMGRKGQINYELLNELNDIPFYKQNPPKSLGREWMENVFYPVLNSTQISDLNKLRTVYEHIAIQIANVGKNGKLLITGGGAFNTFLIERIKYHSNLEVVIPDSNLINYKEALIFAFLGVLRIQNKINCYSSVTGATKDSSCGVIFQSIG